MKRILILLLILLVSCSPLPQTEVAGTVNLKDLQPLPTPSNSEAVPLRLAIAAVISPKGTLESYSPLLQYLETKLNRPVELIQRRTYLEVNDLIEHGEVDLAFVCTSAYVQGHDTFGMELLAAPQVEGKTTYNSYLIIPADSKAQSMSVLRGEVYVHPSMTRVLLEDMLPASRTAEGENAWESLSEREQEVLKMVALGHTSAEIAEQLSLSAKTVETYREVAPH